MDGDFAWVMGCGCTLIVLFELFMGWVTQQVWLLVRPYQPIEYWHGLVLWVFISAVLAYFWRKS